MSQDKQRDVDSNWERIHKTHYAAGSSNTVTSSYALTSSYATEVTDPRFKLTASYYNPYETEERAKMWKDAWKGHEQVKATALENAKQALEEAFENNKVIHTLKQKSKDEEAFETYTKQLGRHTAEEALEQKKKAAPKELVKKTITFPKHLSYEGSVVLCVMLSMNEVAYPHLSNLPIADQTLIRSLISKDISVNFETFEVRFDEHKDFILKFATPPIYDTDGVTLVMFNSVAHPRPEDLKTVGVVPVEKDGDKIEVGGKIVLNRRGIEKLIGVDNKPKNDVEEETPRRQPVAGRNAFEIRSDVMQMALDYANHSKSHLTPEEIVGVARKFYAFVENKR